MIRHKRLESIEEFVLEHKYASTEELMKELKVSKATIHRDLALLADNENLKIVRGGVMKRTKESTNYEPSYDEKISLNDEEKTRIAQRACELIEDGTTIILDSGTTTLKMSKMITNFKGLMVATCDILNAVSLAKQPDVDVMVVGGGMLRKGFYTILGGAVEKMINTLNFNKAFISCDAVNLKNGAMITNFDEILLKQSIISSSKEVILLADHKKMETVSFGSFANINKFDKIITGIELSDEIYYSFINAGIDIERV